MPNENITQETTQCTCADCSASVPQDEITNRANRDLCESCADNYCLCEQCDADIHTEDSCLAYTLSRQGRALETTVCNRCLDNNFFQCDDCSEYHENENAYSVRGRRDRTICRGCYENGDYFTCDACDDIRPHDFIGLSNDSGTYCCDCRQEDESVIQDYSTRTPRRFFGKAPFYFGVELEVENVSGDKESKAEKILQTPGMEQDFIIVKNDGSLSDGFEIVTCPADYSTQVENWHKIFDNLPSGLKSFNTTTCGLHVHCSREPLSELQIAKIVCFTNANANREFVECIAGRTAGKWAQYHEKKLADGIKRNDSRYEAINLQNAKTIEFRIFKGTLKRESLFKAIEFCAALIAFTAPAGMDLINSLNRRAFVSFVHSNKKTYPHLSAFISAKWQGMETKESKNFGFKVTNSPFDTTEQ
jgi:Putative amidoligase enzyme